MYVIDKVALNSSLRLKGYSSLAALLRSLKLHRNALDRYLRGAPVLPEVIASVIDRLEVPLSEVISNRGTGEPGFAPVLPLAAKIHSTFPDISVFIFGSRSRGTNRKYSDFDLGLYSQDGISFERLLKILSMKDDFEEELPFKIDCVNLNSADRDFITNIFPDLKLLAGYAADFESIRGKRGLI